ncbi:MAG: lysylphosphatidylglycerol synthase transmembrane domain-containing protein [Planctomycetota bacterium]|nr:lysylphosphatidylglycerol synthase transmembrane domain-containing protein [Planctomycetota bacterium]
MSVWRFLLRLCVGVALVGYLLYEHGVEVQGILHRMAEFPLLILLGAIVINLLGQALSAYRWGQLSAMVGRPVSFWRMVQYYYSGMFFNMCLPTSIGGDVVRVVGLSRHTGSKSAALASVFMDRNVGLAALLAVGTAASMVLPSASIEATFYKVRYVVPLWPLFVLLCCGYVMANIVVFSDEFCRFVTALTTRWRLGFVGVKINRLHQAVQEYRMPWTRYLWAFALSVVYQASEILLVWLLAQGLQIEAGFLLFVALVPFQAVACLLPITFNGVGVREGIFCAVLMGQLGPEIKGRAMALSLTWFLGVMLISSLIGGLVYVLSGVRRPSVAEAEGA